MREAGVMGMSRVSKKILIIDDEAVFREGLFDDLSGCGYTCLAVSDPAEGILRLKSERYDLILLDIMMEPLDGWDTLDLIKTIPGIQAIPVIMSSAKTIFPDEVLRFGDKISGFIKKPCPADELCEDIGAFFDWYDSLIEIARKAEQIGVPEDVCSRWTLLSRQVQAFKRLKQVSGTRCIPNEWMNEEDCISKQFSEIDQIILDKSLECDQISREYPALSTVH